MSVTAQIDVAIDARMVGTADLGAPAVAQRIAKSVAIVPGTDAIDKADVLWGDQRTLASNATENLDLAGVLAGLLGGTVTAAEITAVYLESLAANTTALTFFGAASNPFNGPLTGTTPKITLGPGDLALLTNRQGWGVTAGTGDIVLVANATGAAATYKIVIIGRTVAA